MLFSDVLRNRAGFDDPLDKIRAYADQLVATAQSAVDSAVADKRAKAEQTLTQARADRDRILPPAPSTTPAAADGSIAPLALQDGYAGSATWPALFDGTTDQPGLRPLAKALRDHASGMGGPALVARLASLPSWLGPSHGKLRDGGAAWEVKVGGQVYRLSMSARLTGPATASAPGATGSKVYERGNQWEEAGVTDITQTRLDATTTGQGVIDRLTDALPIKVQLSATATGRLGQTDSRATNLLHMEGLRANKMTQFDQTVAFRYRLREITALAKGQQNTGDATAALVVEVPTEGTKPHGTPRPSLHLTLNRMLPTENTRILDMTIVESIFNAIRDTGTARVGDLAYDTPRRGTVLTFENRRGLFRAMLATNGARIISVATADDFLDLGRDGHALIEAHYGPVQDIFFMEKAELENYDHGTDYAGHAHQETETERGGIQVDLMAPLSAGELGGRFAFGRETGSSRAHDNVNSWMEHRAWLRKDSSVYFIYVLVYYRVTIHQTGQLTRTHALGHMEMVTDQAGARQLGIPLDTLRSVVPTGLRAKEFGQQPGQRSLEGTPGPLEAAAQVEVSSIQQPPACWLAPGVLFVGDKARWHGAAEEVKSTMEVVRRARGPVVAVNRPVGPGADGFSAQALELSVLGMALLRYGLRRQRPVVLAMEHDERLMAVVRGYRSPVISRGTGTDGSRVWRLVDAGGGVVGSAPRLTGSLVAAADAAWSTGEDVAAVPAVLAGWLAQADWSQAGQYLLANVEALRGPDSSEAMSALLARDPDNRLLLAYDRVLALVRASEPGTALRVPVASVFDYLVSRPDRESRKPLDDQLVQLLWSVPALREQAVALAAGVFEFEEQRVPRPDGQPIGAPRPVDYGLANARVIAVITYVLAMPQAQAARLAARLRTHATTAGVDEQWDRLLHALISCEPSPYDRIYSLLRMEALRDLVAMQGIPGHATLTDCPAPDHAVVLDHLGDYIVSCGSDARYISAV